MKLLAVILSIYLLLAITLAALTYFMPHWIEVLFHSNPDSNTNALEIIFAGSIIIMTSLVSLAIAAYLTVIYWRE